MTVMMVSFGKIGKMDLVHSLITMGRLRKAYGPTTNLTVGAKLSFRVVPATKVNSATTNLME